MTVAAIILVAILALGLFTRTYTAWTRSLLVLIIIVLLILTYRY